MRSAILCLVIVALPGRLVALEDAASPAVANVPHCYTVLSEQADMPPLEPGVILDVPVREGQQVTEKQLLLQLDDRKAQKELEVAEAKSEAAKTKFEAADINVRYAKAAKDVADAEYRVNEKANADVPGSVSKVRLSELLLKCKETELSIEKANSDTKVAADEAKVAAAEVEAARVMVERHKVLSPISGVVVNIRAHKGEAVQPSQPVMHVIKIDSLWVEGNVSAAKYARAELEGCPVTVTVDVAATSHSDKRPFPGKIIFAKPMIDTGGTFLVRAKIDNVKLPNGAWLLNPGMQAEMNIQLK